MLTTSPRNFLEHHNFNFFLISRSAFRGWWSRDPLSHSAAAAYYAVFSLPGFLIIIMTIAAMAFDQSSAEDQILSHIRNVLGHDVAESMRAILENTQNREHDFWAMVVGGFTLFFGATGLFVQLQKSLNQVWNIEVKSTVGFLPFLKSRVTALGITISLGFLFLISLSVTAALTALSHWLALQFSAGVVSALYGLNFIISFIIISILFALIYKVLPDIHLKWSDAIKGGSISAILFIIGEYGLSFYFKLAEPQSTFGAAGSIILFLIWVFYSCLVLFFGAEFIRSYMNHVKDEKPNPTIIAKHSEQT